MKQHLHFLLIATAVTAIALGFSALPASAVITETIKLVPDDSVPGDDFGESVAISGGRAVVASPGSGSIGAAYLFDATTGQQLSRLSPDDEASVSFFGSAVAAAGNLALVRATALDGEGKVYVFDLTTGNQLNILSADDAAPGDAFGASLVIHGTTALIGAPLDDDGFNNAGSAYLFDIATGNQLMKFTADTPEDLGALGGSVAFDGGLVAAYDSGSQPSVLLFDPLTGNQLADIPAPDISLAGSSVAIRGDRLLIGAPSVFPAANAGLYDISDPNNITSMIVPWPGASGGFFFGKSVALNDEAALISTWAAGELTASGIVHLFDPDTGDLLESFGSSDAVVDDRFGWSIGLGGQTLIAGAPGDSTMPGAAYLFTIPEPSTLVLLLLAGPALLHPRRRARRSAIAR